MNKIYKVIWSKVKHQYVVVSELAHSNGKQSRTAKRSLRSRIAALVVCGAIAAFGVLGITEQQAFATPEGGIAGIDQYIAYKTEIGTTPPDGYYKVNIVAKNDPNHTAYYMVRDGFSVDGAYIKKQDGTGYTFVITKVYAPDNDLSGTLISSKVTVDGTDIVTNSGEELNKVALGNYAAVSNGGVGGAEANTDCHYIIETENGWENVGVNTDKFDTYFKTTDDGLNYDEEKGVYTYKGEVVNSNNLYYINIKDSEDASKNGVKPGVFVVDDKVYTSTVYGNTNEILTTVKDTDGSLKTFWATDAESNDIYLKDSNLKVGDLNTAFRELKDNDIKLYNNDIKEITITPTENVNAGEIGLLRNNGKEVSGAVTISSTTSQANGKGNAQIKFSQKNSEGRETSAFVVDAGSIVKANEETTANDETLTSLSVDGTNYKLSQGKTYDDGAGISISQDDTNTISVNTGNGLKIENDQVVANVDGTTVKTNVQGQLTATTLDKTASAAGKETIDNGYNYKVVDTAGNEVEITDVASASKLGEVAENAAKHTTAYGADDNISVENKATDGKALNYEVKLNPNLKVDSVTAGGENGTVINSTGLSVGGNTYVTSSGLNANNQKITKVADGDDDSDAVNFGQLKEYTSGTSKTDYQLVTNPNSEDGKYTVNDKGEVTLTVQDMNKENGETKQVTLSDIASATDVGNLTTTVEAGWTATAADNNGTVKVDKEHDYTLAFNGDNNITVTAENQAINVGLNPVVTLDDGIENGNNVQLSGTNGTISAHNSEFKFGGTGNYDNANDMTFDQNGLTVTNTQTMRENDETTTSSTVINGGSITTGNVTAGGITVNADNGGTVNGLTNKTWDAENYISGQAATEDQLKEAVDDIEENDYDGWKVSANGVENGVDVTTGSTVDFSNTDGNIVVGQDGTNLTFDLAKDITLDDGVENGNNVQLSGTNGTISAHNSKFIFDGTGNYDNANDMTFDQNGLTVTNTQTMRENGETATSSTVINGGSITTGNVTAGGITVNADNGGTINGLTNKTWNADNYVSGQAATEDQLKEAVDDIEENDYDGWKVSANGVENGVDVTTGSTVDFSNTDGNIVVGQDGTNLTFDLAKDITLDDGVENGNNVKLSGTNGTINAHNSELIFGGTGKYDNVNDMTFNQNGLTITNTQTMRDTGETTTSSTVINGGSIATGNITAGGITVNADNGGTVNGLTNKTWDADNYVSGQAATEDQLQEAAAASKTTVSNGTNTTVTSVTDPTDGHVDYQVNLNDNVYLGGNRTAQNSNIKLDGEKGNIQVGSNIALLGEDGRAIIGGVDISTTFDDIGKKSATITGLSNTTWDADKVVIDRAATEGQLQMVSDKVTAGWTATDDAGNKINVNPETRPTLNFASGKNITVSANEDSGEVEVSLNDNINLNNRVYINGDPEEGNNTIVDIKSSDTSKEESIFAVEDKGNGSISIGGIDITNVDGPYLAVGDGKLKFYKDGGLSTGNATGTFSVRPDGDLEINGKNSSFNVDAETGNVNAINNSGSAIMMNDDSVALNASGNGVVISDEGITLNTNGSAVTVDRFNGATFTNTNTGETTNINGDIITTDTVKGLSNTTWDDELATQVANSEELQGTAATQGQLQQAVSAVATEAAKQHTTVSGDDNLTVKSSVNENGGTNYQVTLDDDITLGNPKAGNTEGERSFTINTTAPEGYVPDSYKEENSSGAEFIKENGGFMLFATDTQGHGIFGVTAKGSAWAKDFKTYTTDIYGNNTQYSLNDVGDAVAQMSSYYNKENGKSYTVFSRYLNEAEKDNPFATVDENATRDIPLALRDDGAVLIGATIKGDDFTDNGIRINAETETTYDGDGNEVTNNIATITGLENTEWKPPTPVATFAANDINTTSRAATEAQLDDLYSAVAAYDVNVDGTIDYSHIALAGAPYGASRAGNGTPTGGTSITNVAYASGKDGSEAVNVDYLNDAISDAAENGSISTSDQHLVANTETGSNGVYKPNDDGNVNLIVSDEKGNSSTITIGDVASKEDLDNLKDDVGDLDYSKVEGDTIIDGDSVTDAIGKLDNKIENISGTATDADNNTVTGGKINSDGTISLTQKDKDSIKLEGQLTDSGVVQEGTSFDKETGTITITSQDKYSGETSSVKVEGIASTEVVGATNKEDLATAYKDADKDGNATTEYITDSESMVEADVALDHAIQDVANTSYANDMVLSNRIDSVEKRLGNVEERIDKVGAMAAAIANLRTMGFDPEAPTEIAIGVGQYKSETGIAIGVFHYPNQDFMLSASLSSSGDELMGGIGATWKLGRKSAAERAKDEEARHLEQAEEMKKLAQQEKVKAQAQRHAKLLAERQQASQKNA